MLAGVTRRVPVTETGADTGRFVADLTVTPDMSGQLAASYGHLAFRKTATVVVE